ncbi:MAG: VOC family protein, partial [Pedobacter sp.]
CTSMVTTFDLDGQLFMALNGGPHFTPNPSISFYVVFSDQDELTRIWDVLIDGGKTLIKLDKYDWSEQYGWLQDRYNINWQFTLGDSAEVGQTVVPMMMFCGNSQNKAKPAMDFYTHLFPNSETVSEARYAHGQAQVDATIVHARMRLNGNLIMAMDSGVKQPFNFNEGVSFVIDCDTQDEIDYYWNKFTEKGEESMCGWCKDQFGVSWQIVPRILGALMTDPDKAPRVAKELFKMKKLDIDKLKSA